jgi:hypothetical protein
MKHCWQRIAVAPKASAPAIPSEFAHTHNPKREHDLRLDLSSRPTRAVGNACLAAREGTWLAHESRITLGFS